MRISNDTLQELIDNEGELKRSPVSRMGVFRLALDLFEAREKIRRLLRKGHLSICSNNGIEVEECPVCSKSKKKK